MHLCPCARGPPHVRSKANWWIGSQEPSVNAKSPLLRRSDLFDAFCTWRTWFEFLHLTIPVELTLAAHCHVWILAYAKSLQDNWGRQKAVVLTYRCEKIERLRLHPWTRRFGRVFMQAVASS